MQAERVVRALRLINDALQSERLSALVLEAFGPTNRVLTPELKAEFSNLLWDGVARLRRLEDDPEVVRVLKAFGVDQLVKNESLTFLLRVFESIVQTNDLGSDRAAPARFLGFGHAIAMLHVTQRALETMIVSGRREGLQKDEAILEIRIFDRGEGALDSQRLKEVIETIEDLHSAVLDASDGAPAHFSVAYMDSGSDWMLAFKSAKAVVTLMRSLIAEWQRLRRLDLDLLRVEGGAITEQLGLLGTVQAAVDDGRLSAERGAHIRERILLRLDALTNFGVGLEGEGSNEMEAERQLLTGRHNAGLIAEHAEPGIEPPALPPADRQEE